MKGLLLEGENFDVSPKPGRIKDFPKGGVVVRWRHKIMLRTKTACIRAHGKDVVVPLFLQCVCMSVCVCVCV